MKNNQTITRQTRTLDRLTLALADCKGDLQSLQTQTFEYNLLSPSADYMRISNELYNLRVNMGLVTFIECPF